MAVERCSVHFQDQVRVDHAFDDLVCRQVSRKKAPTSTPDRAKVAACLALYVHSKGREFQRLGLFKIGGTAGFSCETTSITGVYLRLLHGVPV